MRRNQQSSIDLTTSGHDVLPNVDELRVAKSLSRSDNGYPVFKARGDEQATNQVTPPTMTLKAEIDRLVTKQ